jgi:hypothetical protein
MAMQTLAASKQLRSDLASLSALDEAAISTFITLASDQLHVGPAGYKAIAAAAEQAGIDEDAAAVAVDALVQLLAETAKLDLAEPAIREALDGLDVSGAVQDALVQASLEERGAARRVAGSMAHSLPALRRLDWRLDVQVSEQSPVVPPSLQHSRRSTNAAVAAQTRCTAHRAADLRGWAASGGEPLHQRQPGPDADVAPRNRRRHQRHRFASCPSPSSPPAGCAGPPEPQSRRRVAASTRPLRAGTGGAQGRAGSISLQRSPSRDLHPEISIYLSDSRWAQAELRDVEVICGQLREALQESRSNHARRIARLLK